MKIIRYQDPQGQIHFAAEQPDGSVWRIQGDIYRILQGQVEKGEEAAESAAR
jgi:hypothetical protein